MRIRGATAGEISRPLLLYVRRRLIAPRDYLSQLLSPAGRGRQWLTVEERRAAVRSDAVLRRAGIACLWRSAIVTEMLRRRGVAARIRLSVNLNDPRLAHAECEVGEETIRGVSKLRVALR